ncbi:predicted protein [Pyrenophora tritici-repentis Pt-1C-BFP]|uniref:Uncharacterized protein n=1 Tax=Pyrenophora tritici-repentis (strain Pt-1C-BFP) TaxID=426418 RepID=B2W6F4_PYRTR|nr:uncharacterized protein PTRG_05392 [Pyrenophora tritici-repentis Pt-1C-BFP]EDU48312.1 predicted protein [Pyrenophora tritici-repentis Pt-1C-BFP]
MLFSVSFALLLASISQSTLAEVVEIDKAYNVECQGRKTVPNYCTAAGGDFRSIPVETWQGSRTGSLGRKEESRICDNWSLLAIAMERKQAGMKAR